MRWYKKIEQKDYFGLPMTVWATDFEPPGAASFMPAARIHSRCSAYFGKDDVGLGLQSLLVTIPLERKVCL